MDRAEHGTQSKGWILKVGDPETKALGRGQRDGATEVQAGRQADLASSIESCVYLGFNHFNEECGHSPNSIDVLLSSIFCVKQYQ